MKTDILELLLSHDIVLECKKTERTMTADTAEWFEGEFIVHDCFDVEIYRGRSFVDALFYLETFNYEDKYERNEE